METPIPSCKSRNINIRIAAHDLEQIKERAAEEGIPYQTLIASIIHRFINGTLVDEKAVIKAAGLLTSYRPEGSHSHSTTPVCTS